MADPFKKKKKDEESRITDTKTGTTSTSKPSVYKPNAGKAATTPKTTASTKTTTPAKRLAQDKRTTGITRETDTGTRTTSRLDYLGALGRSEPEKINISKGAEDRLEKERQARLAQLHGTEEKLAKARGHRPASQRETPSEEYHKSVGYWEYVKNAKEQAATETISLQNAIAEQRRKTELLGWDIKAKENELFNLKNRLSELSSRSTAKPVDYGSVAGVGEPGGRGVNSAENAAEALDVQERIKQLERDIGQAKTYQYYKKGNDVLSALQKTNYSAYKYVDAIAQYPADWYLKNSENGGAIDDGELLKQIQDTKDAAANDAKAMLRKMGYTDADIEQLVDFRVRQINEEYTLNLIATAQQMAQQSAVGASIASVATNIPAGIGFVDAAIQKAQNPDRPIDYNSRAMAPSLFTNTARQQVSQDLIDKYGEKGKLYSFLYQTGMSMADSTVNMGLAALGVPESIGLTILGGSAATATMKEAHDRGLTDTQALTIALISGAAEYATEKIGLDEFIETLNKPKGSSTLLRNLINNALAEGGEEVASDVVNFIADAIITGDRSEFNTRIKELKALGYSEEECYKYAILEQVANTALSFAGGALSGVAMGGVASGVNAANNAKVTTDYYTGLAAGKGTVAYDAAKNLQLVIDEISSKSEEEITPDDHMAYQEAIDGLRSALDSLSEEELTEARKEGRELKKADKAEIKTAIGEYRGIQRILNQLRPGESTELDTTQYHQNGIVQNAAALVATGKQKNISSAVSTVMKSPEAIEALGLSFEKKTSNTQKRTQILTALKGLVEQAQEAQPTETPVEVNNSTEEAPATETPAAVSEEAVSEEAPMSETLPSYEEYEKGVLENNPEATPEQIKQWYADLSQAYEDVQQEQQAKQTAEEQAKQVKQDIAERKGKRVYIKEAKKAVDYDTFRRWSLGYAKADGESYTEAEIRTAFDAGVAATQAETAKYEVKRRKGVTDASNRIDKAFKKNQLGIGARVSFDATEFGGTSATEHAFYDPKTKSVVFNGDILDTEAALVYYLGHEVVHPAAQVDAGLADAIIETFQQLEEAGKLRGELSRLMRNFDAELKTLQKAYQDHENELAKRDKREARTIDEGYAREEFAANLMRYAFSHTKLFKDIAGRRPGLVARMKQSVGRVMSAVAGDEELDTMLQGIADRLDEALKKVPNANLLEYNPETITDEALTEQNIESLNEQNDGRLFSLSTMRQDLDGYMQDLRDAGLVGEGKPMSDQDLTDLFNGINKVMDYVEDHIDEIERNENYRNMTAGNRPFNPYKNNADPHYKLALDFSTLCRKRLLTQAITERLQGALKRALTPVEQVKVRDMIKKLQAEGKKIDVACALCYVEAARLKSPKVINDFLNNRAKTIWLYHSLKDSTFKRDVYQKRSGDWKEQHGLPRNATKAEMKAAGVSVKDYNKFLVSIRDNYQSWLQQNNPERYAQLARSVAAAEAMDASEFLNAQSLARMRNNPDLVDIYDAFITKIREATRSKAQETDVPYVRGDVNQVGQSLIDQMNEESGFRHQSWSDFQAMHLLDTVAAIMELATRGAKMHTYTKVADMVRFLGETGMMMNMSLIPAGETGFDENGNLLFDPVEGMDYQTMLDLRRKFHSTAGNIAIGISDAQILAMLNSPEIDYIIPYHTSGLNADMRRRMGIRAWKDYTQSQNEKGDDWDKKAPKLREWFNESEALLAPDGVAYMVEASRKYLQLCHERGLVPKFPQFLTKNSDGSYSLRDDAQNYWKLLIDRKMVDQYTGGIIQQKAVLPKFNVNTMMDILQNEVNSEAARDAREAEDYIVNKVLTEGMGVVTKEELERARIIRDATARVAVENAAEEMGFGKRYSIGNSENDAMQRSFSIAYEGTASDSARKSLEQAQDMLREYTMHNSTWPVPADVMLNIREKTGWWMSSFDHHWRYWVPDEEARWNEYNDNLTSETGEVFDLYDVIRHPRLFNHYPQLENTGVIFDLDPDGTTQGSFDPDRDLIHLKAGASIFNNTTEGRSTFSTLLHEIQHAIQQSEVDRWNSIQEGSNSNIGYKQAFVAAFDDLTDGGRDMSVFDGLSYKQAVYKIEQRIAKLFRSTSGMTEAERQGTVDEFFTAEDVGELEKAELSRRKGLSVKDAVQEAAYEYYYQALGEIDARTAGITYLVTRAFDRDGATDPERLALHNTVDKRIQFGEESVRGDFSSVREDRARFDQISKELGWDGTPSGRYSANYPLSESSSSESKYWFPKLTQQQWGMLNSAMQRGLSTEGNNLDEYTKWLYTKEKGTAVFALFSTADTDGPTVLYAVAGAKATHMYEHISIIQEEYHATKIDGSRESISRLAKSVLFAARKNDTSDVSSIRGRSKTDSAGPVHSGESRDNARRDSRGSGEAGTKLNPDTEASEDSGASSVDEDRQYSIDYQGTALLQESTVDKYLADYASKTSPNYAQAYIAWMSPNQFLQLTTSTAGRRVIEAQSTDLDADKFADVTRHQPIQLRINHETGEVEGHEGRHRAVALSRAGVQRIPVLFFDSSNKTSKTTINSLDLQGQDFGSSRSYATVTVEDLLPLNYANRESIIKEFATESTLQKFQKKYNNRDVLRYSIENIDGAAIPVIRASEADANFDATEAYLDTLVNESKPFSTLLYDALPVYIGKDLPGEYRSSEDAQNVSRDVLDAKMRAGRILDEMILLAEPSNWGVDTGGKHKNKAANGWYYADTTFAVERIRHDGKERRLTIYTGRLLIRNDANGKSYLYDMTDVKEKKVVVKPIPSQSGIKPQNGATPGSFTGVSGLVRPSSNYYTTENGEVKHSIENENDELFQAFVEAYENKQGEGQLQKDFPTIEQQLREARRELKRAQKKADSEQAKRLVAEKATKEAREAWQKYARKTVTKQIEQYEAKLAKEREKKVKAVQEAIKKTRDEERKKAKDKVRKATDKVRKEAKNKEILSRNAALSTLRNKDLAQKRREAIDVKQGPIDTLRKSPQERTFREKVADAAEKLRVTGRDLYAKFVSQAAEIERMDRRQKGPIGASTYATIVGGVGSTVSHVFNNALVDKGGDVIGASFTETFICTENDAGKVIDEPMQALLQDYLLHRHNIDRMSFVIRSRERLEAFEQEHSDIAKLDAKQLARLAALTKAEAKAEQKEEQSKLARDYSRLLRDYLEAQNKPVFADLNDNPISAETSRARVAQLEKEAPWLIEKAAGIDKWWDSFMRAWVVGTSITEEDYDHMREIYPHYVPTYRKDKGGLGVSFSNANGATPGQFTKRAIGSTKEVVNVEDSFASLVQKAIKQARTNELYQNVVDTAMQDTDGTFADMLYFDWLQYNSDVQDLARIDIGDHLDERDTAGLSKDGDGYRVSAWYDGELVYTYVSEALFKSLSLTVGHASDRLDKLARLGSALTSPMKTAITGINPNFALRNVARDVPTAIVNSVSGLAFPKYWARALGEIRRNSEHWQRYQALGGGDALYYNNEGGYGKATNMTKSTAGSVQRGWNTVKGKVGWFNEITESITRFAEYLATIDRLGDTYEGRLQARKNAAEVTVDFSRHGEYGKAINAWIPYWNPAVQGIDKVIRSVVETKEGEAKLAHAMKTILRAGVTTALLDAILHILLTAFDKEKDWEKLDDRTKDTYYCIPYADHKYIKIPKNREWGAILGTPLVRLWEWGFNGRSNPFENYFETSFWPNFMPGMPLMLEDGKLRSDIIGISQALDLANNTDFAGRTIIPYAYQQGSKAGQYDAETSQFTKWLSDALGNKLSPMQLDYIVKDYFGDFGKMFTQATSVGLLSGDIPPEDVADYALSIIVNPWKADNRFSNQYMSKYYEIRDALEKKVNDLKNHTEGDSYKDTIEYKTYQALTKGLGKDISDLNKSIRNETDEEVKGRVKGQMVDLAQQAIEFYNDSMAGKIKDPELVVAYRDLPQAVSEALIKLDGLTKDYSIKPSENNTDTAVDAHGLKFGDTVITQYKLDDEAKKVRGDLRAQYYDEYMLKAVNSSAFKSASKEKQAEMLEDAKSDAYKAAADDFSEWLAKNRKPELKDERELPKAYKALSSSTRTELTNLYGKPGTEKYTFTPADNTTKSYSDPDSKQGTKTTREYKLDDEALAYYDKLRQDYYESYVSKAMRSSAYKKASNARKAEILAEARKQAYDDAREQLMKWLKKNRKSTPKD